jgi:hypothetical protein
VPHLRRWGAVYILFAMWAVFEAVQLYTNFVEYSSDQAEHGQAFESGQFAAYFFARFAENHASESWQLAVQALLIVGFAHVFFRKGQEDVERLEAKIDALCTREGINVDEMNADIAEDLRGRDGR